MIEPQDDPVKKDSVVNVDEEILNLGLPREGVLHEYRPQNRSDELKHGFVRQGNKPAHYDMKENATSPAGPFDGETAGEMQDQRGQERPHGRVGQLNDEGTFPISLPPLTERHNVVL